MVYTSYLTDIIELADCAEGAKKILTVTALLSMSGLKPIADEIEQRFYSREEHPHYPVLLMLKLLIIKFYRKLPFRKVNKSLTEEDLENIFSLDELKRGYKLPSGKTLHHFIHKRLGMEGITLIMKMMGEEIILQQKQSGMNCESKSQIKAIIDSTPLEGSRYGDIDYNLHYKMFMCKAHIISYGGYPVGMIYSNGLGNDAPYGRELVKYLAEFHPEVSEVLADGGYDNYEMYADVGQLLHAKPIIQIRENAVLSKEGNTEYIRNIVNKNWRKGGDASHSIEQNLEFLYNLSTKGKEGSTKYKVIVGKYYRNQNLKNETEVQLSLGERKLCEQRHAQYKNVLKFDVKGYRKEARALYVMWNFVTIQCIFMTYLQHGIQGTSIANFI